MSAKTLYVVGGPNGAGKTTFVRRVLKDRDLIYLSADDIAYQISPQDPSLAQFEAGREFVVRLEQSIAAGQNLLVESTLSGRSLARTIERARIFGYRVEVRFLFIDSKEISLSRVRQRVRKGGHDVPVADVFRRFQRTFENFWRLYRPLADLWMLAYNDSQGPVEAAFGTQLGTVVINHELLKRFLRVAESDHAEDER